MCVGGEKWLTVNVYGPEGRLRDEKRKAMGICEIIKIKGIKIAQ